MNLGNARSGVKTWGKIKRGGIEVSTEGFNVNEQYAIICRQFVANILIKRQKMRRLYFLRKKKKKMMTIIKRERDSRDIWRDGITVESSVIK